MSPLLISVLSIAIFHGDPYLGAGLMFSMALGMGVVLIAIGFGAGVLLPRAGAWMDRVKHLFGVMLIGVAIYLLGTIPAVPVLLLWAALLITFGIYLVKSQAPLLQDVATTVQAADYCQHPPDNGDCTQTFPGVAPPQQRCLAFDEIDAKRDQERRPQQ